MADLMQQAREQFEAWMMTQTTHGNEHVLTRVGGGDERYLSPLTSSMWAAWQAALRAAPEGYVLVPVEPTPEMLAAVGNGADGLKLRIWRGMLAARPQGVKDGR